MFDTKFVCTLIALVIAALAICNFERTIEIKENFLLGSGATRGTAIISNDNSGKQHASNMNSFQVVDQLSQASDNLASMALSAGLARAANTQDVLAKTAPQQKENFQHNITKEPFGFQVPPNYQSMLSPRGVANAEGYQNPNVQYNPPPNRFTGYDQQVENYSNMVQENFRAGSGRIGQPTTPVNPESYNYAGAVFNVPQSGFNELSNNTGMTQHQYIAQQPGSQDVLPLDGANFPVHDMTDAIGEQVTLGVRPVTTLNNRNRALGCPLRGDLNITGCNFGWYNSSLSQNPSTSLKQGALAVMGGQTIADGAVQMNNVNQGMDGAYNFKKNAQLNSMVGGNYSQGMLLDTMQQGYLGAMPDTTLTVNTA
tara:strand:- start:466 stop:1572 length:1107 start_codon:yes stop_codon:yes gene_type:complete